MVKLKLGEKVMFGFTVLIAIAAVARGVRQVQSHDPVKPREYYEWNETGLAGKGLYGQMGCNNCHRAMGVGEIGVAPVLDGEGTRRTLDWLARYFENPTELVPGTAHDGSLGPDFRTLTGEQRYELAAFLYGLKSNPGSPNYPTPPTSEKPR